MRRCYPTSFARLELPGSTALSRKLPCGQAPRDLCGIAELKRCHEGLCHCAFWAREIGSLDDEVRVLPPAYLKPFVKRQKDGANSAEAMAETAIRRSMCLVTGIKSSVLTSYCSFENCGVCCEHLGQRHQEQEGAGRQMHSMSCELVLVPGRLCDSPGCA